MKRNPPDKLTREEPRKGSYPFNPPAPLQYFLDLEHGRNKRNPGQLHRRRSS